MKTEETNKLIAEFMGAKQYDETDNFVYFDETNNIFSNDTISIKDLKFHNDWNWLIEVVEKIEGLVSQFNIRTYTLANTYTDVNIIINTDKRIDIELQTSKIEAVYNACIAFIEWYNKQTAEENK